MRFGWNQKTSERRLFALRIYDKTKNEIARSRWSSYTETKVMNSSDIALAVFNFVNQPNYKPMKPRAIAKRLGIDPENLAQLKQAVRTLIKTGKLAYGANHLLLPVLSKTSPINVEFVKPAKRADRETEKPAADEDTQVARFGRQSRAEFTGQK